MRALQQQKHPLLSRTLLVQELLLGFGAPGFVDLKGQEGGHSKSLDYRVNHSWEVGKHVIHVCTVQKWGRTCYTLHVCN